MSYLHNHRIYYSDNFPEAKQDLYSKNVYTFMWHMADQVTRTFTIPHIWLMINFDYRAPTECPKRPKNNTLITKTNHPGSLWMDYAPRKMCSSLYQIILTFLSFFPPFRSQICSSKYNISIIIHYHFISSKIVLLFFCHRSDKLTNKLLWTLTYWSWTYLRMNSYVWHCIACLQFDPLA